VLIPKKVSSKVEEAKVNSKELFQKDASGKTSQDSPDRLVASKFYR